MPIKKFFLGNLSIFFFKNGIAYTFDRHLLKVTGKLFHLLKPKCYLNRLEDIARHATYVNALFTTSPVLSKATEQLLSHKLLSRTKKV